MVPTLKELKENRTSRIDSTFYDKQANEYDLLIRSKAHYFIPEEQVVSGPFGSSLTSDAYRTSGVPFIRIEDIKGGYTINQDEMIYISEEDNSRLKSSQMLEDDIILSKVGNSIGFYARVDEKIGHCNISENNIGIKLGDMPRERKHFILVYLNSKYGKLLTNRRRSGNAQPKLNVFDVAEIPIPAMSADFETMISKLVLEAYSLEKQSEDKQKAAMNLLLNTLGIDSWKPVEKNTSVRSLKDITKRGRIDAEYYADKYDELLEKLSTFDCRELGAIVTTHKSIEPGSDAYQEAGIPFYRVANITESGLCETNTFLEEARYYTDELGLKKDRILFSKDGSIGIAYKIRKDEKAITSGALLHLEVEAKDVLPDYLAVVLNSLIVKMQAERDAGGSVIQHWKPDEIEKVIIPVVDGAVQEEIASLMREGFTLKDRSEELLKKAKAAVECSIGEGEAEAVRRCLGE